MKTQCHPDSVFDMVQNFDKDKKLLARDIGCQSMLDMQRRELDLDVSRDLLWEVDTAAGTLRIGRTDIPIRPYVRRITGLSEGPTEIKADDSVDENMKKLFDELPSSTYGFALSLKSETDNRKFSIKFILAIIGLYAAPSTSPNNKEYKKYFGSVTKCEDMKLLNLCELAYRSLLDGIDRYKDGNCDTCPGCMDILHVSTIPIYIF